jgi:hypothetical protein
MKIVEVRKFSFWIQCRIESDRLKKPFDLFYLNQFHTFIITFIQYIYIHLHSPRPLSISSLLAALREKPPWGAELMSIDF